MQHLGSPCSLSSKHSTKIGTTVVHLHVTGVALAGILAVLHSCLDLKATIGGSQYHHILYFLTPAMKPRMLMTVDKDMNMLPVSVRVGQAVDVVAQVGRTHSMLVKVQFPTTHLLIMSVEAILLHMFSVWGTTRVSSTVCCAHGELTVLMLTV